MRWLFLGSRSEPATIRLPSNNHEWTHEQRRVCQVHTEGLMWSWVRRKTCAWVVFPLVWALVGLLQPLLGSLLSSLSSKPDVYSVQWLPQRKEGRRGILSSLTTVWFWTQVKDIPEAWSRRFSWVEFMHSLHPHCGPVLVPGVTEIRQTWSLPLGVSRCSTADDI